MESEKKLACPFITAPFMSVNPINNQPTPGLINQMCLKEKCALWRDIYNCCSFNLQKQGEKKNENEKEIQGDGINYDNLNSC